MKGGNVLITGVNGFLGRHMARLLLEQNFTVWGIGRRRHSVIRHPNFYYTPCDLCDSQQIFQWMAQHEVQYIIHLAAETDIRRRPDNPLRLLEMNGLGTGRLLEAVRRNPDMKVKGILLAGSAYEEICKGENNDVEYGGALPCNWYGFSKWLASSLGQMYAQLYGLPVVIARTFNVIGPGAEAGVCPSLARQVAEMERGLRPNRLVVGNLELERDFIDVRDVATAYWSLLHSPFRPGEVYQVASGNVRKIREIVDILRRHAQCSFDVTVDEALMRPGDPKSLRGNNEALRKITGWRPQWPFEQSVLDVLNDMRNRMNGA